MPEFKEVERTIEVPKNTGVEGFLHTIREVLKLPRVQSIHIDSRGRVTFKHFARDDETKGLSVNFDALMPYAVIRNGEVVEAKAPSTNAGVTVAHLFHLVAVDQLNPVAFVAGPASRFWKWYSETTKITPVREDELCGIPFLTDRLIEDHVLILCAAYGKGAPLADARKSYKLVIPAAEATQ